MSGNSTTKKQMPHLIERVSLQRLPYETFETLFEGQSPRLCIDLISKQNSKFLSSKIDILSRIIIKLST